MEVFDVRLDQSPEGADRVRLRADVKYSRGDSEEYWYDLPESRAEEASRSGNPWLACLLPLAATLGEPLTLSLPVDPALRSNATRLMSIWKTWYPNLRVVPLNAESESSQKNESGNRVGAFFSGGVDSFFTALRDRQTAGPGERRPIDDLITVWGFDIQLDRPDAFARLCDRNMAVADHLGLELTRVATNMRNTRWRESRWGELAHGAGLASVALALEGRFAAVYIAASGGYRKFLPWGSHLLTDPLFSTEGTVIVADGAAYSRTEKIEILARYPVALESLHVCWESLTDENCGHCGKCLRTILALYLFGALDACRTLPNPPDLIDRVSRMNGSTFADFRGPDSDYVQQHVKDLRRLAQEKGRHDIVSALDRCARRTRLSQAMWAVRQTPRSSLNRISSLLARMRS